MSHFVQRVHAMQGLFMHVSVPNYFPLICPALWVSYLKPSCIRGGFSLGEYTEGFLNQIILLMSIHHLIGLGSCSLGNQHCSTLAQSNVTTDNRLCKAVSHSERGIQMSCTVQGITGQRARESIAYKENDSFGIRDCQYPIALHCQ